MWDLCDLHVGVLPISGTSGEVNPRNTGPEYYYSTPHTLRVEYLVYHQDQSSRGRLKDREPRRDQTRYCLFTRSVTSDISRMFSTVGVPCFDSSFITLPQPSRHRLFKHNHKLQIFLRVTAPGKLGNPHVEQRSITLSLTW